MARYSGVGSNWAEPRCAVNVTDARTATVEMQQPCFWNLVNRPFQPLGSSVPEYVDNLCSALANAGEFYYDRAAGEVLYMPWPGQDMATADAMLAVEETLLQHNASAQHSWIGVTFEYATWLRPMQGDGFVEQQSAACSVCPAGGLHGGAPPFPVGCGGGDVYVVTPGAVVVTGGTDIVFSNCTFQHLGAYAAAASGGSQRVTWERCVFRDISAGAVMLGDLANCDEKNPARLC